MQYCFYILYLIKNKTLKDDTHLVKSRYKEYIGKICLDLLFLFSLGVCVHDRVKNYQHPRQPTSFRLISSRWCLWARAKYTLYVRMCVSIRKCVCLCDTLDVVYKITFFPLHFMENIGHFASSNESF